MYLASPSVSSFLKLTAKQPRLLSARFLPLSMRQYILIPTKSLKNWLIRTTGPSLKTHFLLTALLLSPTASTNASGCCSSPCPFLTFYLFFCVYVLLIWSPSIVGMALWLFHTLLNRHPSKCLDCVVTFVASAVEPLFSCHWNGVVFFVVKGSWLVNHVLTLRHLVITEEWEQHNSFYIKEGIPPLYPNITLRPSQGTLCSIVVSS